MEYSVVNFEKSFIEKMALMWSKIWMEKNA